MTDQEHESGVEPTRAVRSAVEPTRIKSAVGDVERTRLKSRGAAAEPSGSNWAHPEQWHGRDDEALGPGSVIKDRFVIESMLGQGGMGVVYRALDRRKEEAQDRDPYVAVKVLNAEFRRHPRSLIALQREARKAQDLAHPNVITVHDFDRDGTTVYMTMELLDGEPLNKVIAANKLRGLPPAEALPLVRGMAAALAYAHKKGIVHSDFKPGNVFLTRTGDVKVLDFGIARAVPTQLAPDADNTVFDATDLGALTPPYASVEMLEGKPPEPADDVFALGVVAHELLTGRHPFDREPANEALARGVRPPAAASLSRRQRRALAKALSFARAARYPDAGAFLRDLEGPSAVRRAAYGITVVVLAGVAAYAIYENSQIRPAVPFDDLPVEVQRAFAENATEGERALGFGDFALNDAFEYFSRAFELHRNNPRAVAGLQNVANRFLASVEGADASLQDGVLRKLYCHEYLRTYAPVQSACQTTLGPGRCTFAGMGCTGSEPEN